MQIYAELYHCTIVEDTAKKIMHKKLPGNASQWGMMYGFNMVADFNSRNSSLQLSWSVIIINTAVEQVFDITLVCFHP